MSLVSVNTSICSSNCHELSVYVGVLKSAPKFAWPAALPVLVIVPAPPTVAPAVKLPNPSATLDKVASVAPSSTFFTSTNFIEETANTSASIANPPVINKSCKGHSNNLAITPIKMTTAAPL